GVATLSNVSLSGINAGTYAGGVGASFAGDSSYQSSSGTASVSVAKATASITVTSYGVTYDGNSHTATGTASRVGGVGLSAGLTLSGTTHTNAGTYNGDAWSFSGGTNYNDASGTVNDSIAKAVAIVSVNGYSGTYDGNAHGATGAVTGVDAGGAAVGSTL